MPRVGRGVARHLLALDGGGVGWFCWGITRSGIARGIQGRGGVTRTTWGRGIPSTRGIARSRGIHRTWRVYRGVRRVRGICGGRSSIARGVVGSGARSGITRGIVGVCRGVTGGVAGSESWRFLRIWWRCQTLRSLIARSRVGGRGVGRVRPGGGAVVEWGRGARV